MFEGFIIFAKTWFLKPGHVRSDRPKPITRRKQTVSVVLMLASTFPFLMLSERESLFLSLITWGTEKAFY